MAEPPLLESLGAVTALFVAILILSAVGRQATRKSFQKRMFLFSLVLLIAAIVSNILLTLYLTGPASDPSQALIFTKRVQGTFDLLFAMSIGVFVLATAKPEIDSLKAFIDHIRGQLPNPFLFYVFVQFLAIAVLWMSPIEVIVGVGANRIVFPSFFLFTGGLPVFGGLVPPGAEGLCIARKPPKMVAQDYGPERTPILWLSRVANQKNCVRPSPPENVAMAVEHFISVGENPVVLLDGFEYLVSHNDFQSILALIHDLNENVSIRESILLIPLDPKALNEREFALVKRDVQVIEAPDGPRAGPHVEVEFPKVSRKARGS